MIDKIKSGFQGNFALVVPTKALINELAEKIVSDIEPYVLSMDYRVVKTPDDMVLMGQHHFVLVMTQERMPEQKLFFDKYSDFEVAAIDEAISNSDYAFSNMNLDSEKLEMVRKILVVLLDDAKVRDDSPVVKKFFGKASNEVKAKIYSVARQTPEAKTLDLTRDQIDLLLDSIQDDDL